MKILMIFMGLLVLQATFVSYHGDLNRFSVRQSELKYMAEECAAGAAALWDPEAYGEGKLRFRYEEGERYARDFLRHRWAQMEDVTALRADLIFEDDFTESSRGAASPAVTAVLTLECEDLFRLPFLSVTKIQRKARYEVTEAP